MIPQPWTIASAIAKVLAVGAIATGTLVWCSLILDSPHAEAHPGEYYLLAAYAMIGGTALCGVVALTNRSNARQVSSCIITTLAGTFAAAIIDMVFLESPVQPPARPGVEGRLFMFSSVGTILAYLYWAFNVNSKENQPASDSSLKTEREDS
jgi:hypothetical protein